MNTVTTTTGLQVNIHGCFYHLTQSTWRKIQSLGLVQHYGEEENLKLFCGMLDGLAFLPVDDVSGGMAYLREHTPDRLEPLLEYFDSTRLLLSYTAPRLPDALYIHTITFEGGSRTNNICEGWNNAFAKLVGHTHPTIWRAIDSIHKDQAQVATALLRDERGEPPAKHVRRHTHKLQTKLQRLCTDRRGDINPFLKL